MKKVFFSLLAVIVVAAVAVVLFYHQQPRLTENNNRYYKVLCLGDSLTASSYGQYPRSLKHFFQQGKENGELDSTVYVYVYEAAQPGNTSGEYLAYLEKSKILEKINPHIVVLMLGTNDVRIDGDHTPLDRFEKNMKAIIQLLKDDAQKSLKGPGRQVFIATPPPIFHCDLPTFDSTSQERIREEIVPAVKRLAKSENLHLLDVFSFFSNTSLKFAKKTNFPFLPVVEMADPIGCGRRPLFNKSPSLLPGIHPSAEGYLALAGFIYQQLFDYIQTQTRR